MVHFFITYFKQMMIGYFKHFLILLRIRKYGRESITFFNISSGIIDVSIINYYFTRRFYLPADWPLSVLFKIRF